VEQPVAAVPRDNIVCVLDIYKNQLPFMYVCIYLFIYLLNHAAGVLHTCQLSIKLVYVILKSSVPAPQIAQCLCITKIGRLMVFNEIIAVFVC
jgi:hypothetical protein